MRPTDVGVALSTGGVAAAFSVFWFFVPGRAEATDARPWPPAADRRRLRDREPVLSPVVDDGLSETSSSDSSASGPVDFTLSAGAVAVFTDSCCEAVSASCFLILRRREATDERRRRERALDLPMSSVLVDGLS